MFNFISMVIDDNSGSLIRVLNIFSRRNIHLNSVNINKLDISKNINIDIYVYLNKIEAQKIIKQLEKLICVIKINHTFLSKQSSCIESLICKIKADANDQIVISRIISFWKGIILYSEKKYITVGILGYCKDVNNLIAWLKEFCIINMSRTLVSY